MMVSILYLALVLTLPEPQASLLTQRDDYRMCPLCLHSTRMLVSEIKEDMCLCLQNQA